MSYLSFEQGKSNKKMKGSIMDTIQKILNIIKKCMFFGNDIQEIFVLKILLSLSFYWTVFASPVYTQQNGSETVIVTCNNKQHFGKLLYVTESNLLLWQSKESYNPNKINDYVKMFDCSDIDCIVIDKKSQFWKGAGYGLILGGTSGAIAGIMRQKQGGNHIIWTLNSGNRALEEGLKFGIPSALIGGIIGAVLSTDKDFEIHKNDVSFQTMVPELRKRAIFPYLPPPELQTLVDHNN